MKKSLKITLAIVAVLVALTAVALFLPRILTICVYKDYFDVRSDVYEPRRQFTTDFDRLQCEKYTFASNNGQNLTGWRYYKNNTAPNALVVMAHGFGAGGQNSYMHIADYFVQNGFAVFTYDATGNGDSEGEGVNGLPQGIIDLDHALNYVKTIDEFDGLPVVLWGHSWGAYSVGNAAALHPEVRAVAMVSCFDQSLDMIEAEGRNIAGDAVDIVLAYALELEQERFGDYADMSCSESLAVSQAAFFIVHSADDPRIPKSISYDVLHEKYCTDPRFTFVEYTDRGHDYISESDAARAYIDEFNAGFDEWLATLDGGFTPEAKAAYLTENLDKKRLNDPDDELMGKIVDFYNANISAE